MNLFMVWYVIKGLWSQAHWLAHQQAMVHEWRKKGVQISDRALIHMGHRARLEIAAGSTIGPYTILDLTNDPNAADGESVVQSTLIIGKRTAINEFNNIRAAGGKIRIGDHCLISQFVSIIASNHSIDVSGLIRDLPWDRKKNWIEIGEGVWIGSHAVILPGVKIGTGSVIAAGAVVADNVPDYAIVTGVPATVKRFRPHRSEVG